MKAGLFNSTPRTLTALLVAVFLGHTGAARGLQEAESTALLERALVTHERFDQREWRYTVTVIEDGQREVARHEPLRSPEERWRLISVDGRLPTETEAEEFRRERAASEDGEEQSSGEELRSMISPGTARLIEETDGHALYSFELLGETEEDAEFNRHLEATLRIVKGASTPYVDRVEMRAGEPFKAAAGIKIKEFSSVMTFGPVGQGKAVLPLQVEIHVLGRALWVKKIEQEVDLRFTDYRLVEEISAD